jgi:hypothetical protein
MIEIYACPIPLSPARSFEKGKSPLRSFERASCARFTLKTAAPARLVVVRVIVLLGQDRLSVRVAALQVFRNPAMRVERLIDPKVLVSIDYPPEDLSASPFHSSSFLATVLFVVYTPDRATEIPIRSQL